ncbi:hypothetical protein JOQ06_024045, partial [Pogonophryne albipinna]
MFEQDHVNLWRGTRTIRICDVDITLENIGRIFKLTPSSIYLIAETVVLLPSSLGYLGNIEREGRYEVCGEEASTPSSSGHPAPPNLFRFGGRPVASAGRPGPAAATKYLGTEEKVVLCDGKGNRMLEGAGKLVCYCLGFWRQNARKIVALLDSSYKELMRRKRRRT